jgi:hypothetical protein
MAAMTAIDHNAGAIMLRIPIYPAGHSDFNPATRSNPFPATCTDLISARRGVPSQQVDDGHLMVRGFRSRLC